MSDIGRRKVEVAAEALGGLNPDMAMEVIHWITGISEPATLGRGLGFDLRDFSNHWETIDPDPDCELACGRMATCPPRTRRPRVGSRPR